MKFQRIGCLTAIMLTAAVSAMAQNSPDPAALQDAQRKAMRALEFMDGTWRGEAWTMYPSGAEHTLVQTERVGTLLDGTVRMIEGRGYNAEGDLVFNALGVISFSPDRKAFNMRSYAMGFSGDYLFTPTGNGFKWEMQYGSMQHRYTATIRDGVWHEIGERTIGDLEPVKFFEMTLQRIGDTDWPAGGAVGSGAPARAAESKN